MNFDFVCHMSCIACLSYGMSISCLYGLCRRFISHEDMAGAWAAAKQANTAQTWRTVGRFALKHLDIDTAVTAFRTARDAGMVLALEHAALLEDRHQIAGEVLALADGNIDAAQQMFLRGNSPAAALQMRKDLKHWSAALRLAEEVEPASVADVMSQHAAALELKGNAAAALAAFKVLLLQLPVR
jgi:WD repeat-containing protein 19